MPERKTMTSETLKEKFPAVYRQFFATCQRVASASNSFLWTGEFSGFYGGITVGQKLPIRSYVGFEMTHERKIYIDSQYQTFDPAKQTFVEARTDDRLVENLERYLKKHFAEDDNFTGVTVHFLTEVPLGHSLGSNGAIAAALAILLVGFDDLEQTFKTAREVLALSQAGHSSGVTAYIALVDEINPVVFYSKKDSYFAKSISELSKTKNIHWPLDWGLIYTGVETNAESVIVANDQTLSELENDAASLKKLLKNGQELNFRETYTNMLNMTAGLTVTALVELAKSGHDNQVIEDLLNSLNQFQNLLRIVHGASSIVDRIYGAIHALANKKTNDVGSGVKISGIGKGGVVLFTLPYGTHRTSIIELIKRLRTESNRSIQLDYASWLDGIGGSAGKLEQDMVAGVKSSWLERDNIELTILDKGIIREEIIANERVGEHSKLFDILLDQTTDKILIGGQPMTSKELPSQKATVEIMADLIGSRGLKLDNTRLGGSYGASRYDLAGKIVLPLTKQVKKLTGRDLQLEVSGGMYSDYSLSFEPSNIIIGIIRKKH